MKFTGSASGVYCLSEFWSHLCLWMQHRYIRLHFIIFFSLFPASQSAIGELDLIQSSQLTPHKQAPHLRLPAVWRETKIRRENQNLFGAINTCCNPQYVTKSHKNTLKFSSCYHHHHFHCWNALTFIISSVALKLFLGLPNYNPSTI